MPSPRISKDFPHDIYFLTFTIIEWIDIFTKPEYFHILSKSLTFCQKNKGLQIFAYVFMTNHIHLIAQSHTTPLHDIVRDFKRHTTKEIKKLLQEESRKYIQTLLAHSYSLKKDSDFQIWQRENHAKQMISEKMMINKIEYIHYNPVKKEYVRQPEDWVYSSALFYTDKNVPLEQNDILIPCTTWNEI